MRAQVFWLLRKYTSLTYIKRMHELYAAFVVGYEEYVKTQDPTPWLRENMVDLLRFQIDFEHGIDRLTQGYQSGYRTILAGAGFGDYLGSPRFGDDHTMHEPIGYRIPPDESVRLYAWADVAGGMAGKVWLTLAAEWSFPRILSPGFEPFAFPSSLAPLPTAKGPVAQPGGEIPVSGIWVPIDLASGCPNYLLVGDPAPKGQRANIRADRTGFPAGPKSPAVPARTDYGYIAAPTRWQLAWEDRRYRDARIPSDEVEYLDPATQPPPWPPRA